MSFIALRSNFTKVHKFTTIFPGGYHAQKGLAKFAYADGSKSFEDDYTDEPPKYEPVNPDYRKFSPLQMKKINKLKDWYKQIRNNPTVEGKMLEFNLKRKYGWITSHLNEDFFDYDSRPYYEHVTRTRYVEGLPTFYSAPELEEKVKFYSEKLSGPLLDCLKLHKDGILFKPKLKGIEDRITLEEDKLKTQAIVNQINRIVLSVVGSETKHLKSCQVDFAPIINAHWFVGGMTQNLRERKMRENNKFLDPQYPKRPHPDDPIERNFQYNGSPLLQVRLADPIGNFASEDDPLCQSTPEEATYKFPYLNTAYGIKTKLYYASFSAGHWTGDTMNGSLLTFHPRHHLLGRERLNSPLWMEDNDETLKSQAMLVSFSRLLSQALLYGFDQFSGLDYPFSSQTVITNGFDWSFYAYQLNTISLDKLNYENNLKKNVCWGTNSMKILLEDEQGIKLNPEVVANLIKFYLNPPKEIEATDPIPHIQKNMNQIEHEVERRKIHFNLRYLQAQRPMYQHNRLFPEIYAWEKIFKIDHQTRPMEARRRFFERRDYDPYNESWWLIDPEHVGKMLIRLREEVRVKKEEEMLEEAKKIQSEKFIQTATKNI